VPLVDDLKLIHSGIRELYELDADRLLLVATDKLSTYDAVHPTLIAGKGQVLTGLSVFWFGLTGELVPNHLLSDHVDVPEPVLGRALVTRRLKMVPLECIVRGYLAGSGWKDYLATGKVAGIALPEGLRESDQLPTPIFTPSTKPDLGHDETVDMDQALEIVGDDALLEQLRELSTQLYVRAAAHALTRGVILADTKFEFGIDSDGMLRVADEVLTPDSSRFWPADDYEPGRGQASFDKQYVRDWAAGSGWDKNPPAPAIPDEIAAGTRERYLDAYERITGEPLTAWLERIGATPA